MISNMSIRNYKSLRDVEVDLERFTVFVGPNASGKSSLLQALNHFCERFHVDRVEHDDAELLGSLSRGAREPIDLRAKAGSKVFRYCVGPPGPGAQEFGRSVAGSLTGAQWTPWKPEPARNPVPRSVLLRLEASKLVDPSFGTPDPTVMSPNGSGLHSALANMALNDPDSWQALQADLRQIIPTVRRLRHTRTSKVQHPAALLFDTVGADSLPANQVSEGTLLVLGLLSALHAASRPNLVLLDDLDRGLHPKAQRELVTLLRRLLQTSPDLQMIATTHSPYMLDCMEVDEVRMTFLKEDGATVCAALTSHPDFPKWKDEMTPGEMWSLFGEKWVVEEVAT